jgi:putative acetyltransferase
MTSVEVRRAAPADRSGVRRVVAAAFGVDGESVAALVDALHASSHVRAELVATAAGAVVGHVVLSHCWVDARERLVDVLVLSPLAVDPAHQRAGTGTRLVAAAIEEAARLGAPALFLEGSPHFYGARGFERASTHGFTRPSDRIPDPAFQVRLLPADTSPGAGLRGRLVYCEPFWAHDSVGLRDPDLREVETALGT